MSGMGPVTRGAGTVHGDGAHSESYVKVAHYFRPTVAQYETFPRLFVNGTTSPVSGTMRMSPIWLPAGALITSISMFSGATALVSGSNQWFALFNSSRALLRQTVDDGATAWGAGAKKTLALTSTFTTTYTGLHYIGVNIVAATTPTLLSFSGGGFASCSEPPILGGPSSSGLTTTAPDPADVIGGSSFIPYAFVS